MEGKLRKIAVIDDDYNLSKLVTNVVEREIGVAAVSFPPMLELITIFKENKFDLLIIDYLMPNIDGLELILNFLSENNKIPVILTTGYPDIEQVQVLKNNEQKWNIRCLKKPFSIEEMLRMVKDALTAGGK